MEVNDRISGLPLDILAHILGLLRIEEAAKPAILCTSLRDAWLSLTHLNFDSEFFNYIRDRYMAESTMSIIDTIIIKHNGPIQKFVFDFNFRTVKKKLRWFDFDEWLLCLTQNGIEEIHLCFSGYTAYILPEFIFSCPTLKTLHLSGVLFEQISTPCIFPNVTSLFLKNVRFDDRKCCAAELPVLRNLTCESVSGCIFTAPKLRSLKFSVDHDSTIAGRNHSLILPVKLDLRTIHSLHLEGTDLEWFVEELYRVGHERTTPNVEHLQLRLMYGPYFDNISVCFQLLQMCPKLTKLDIHLMFRAVESANELLELPNHTLAQTFNSIRELSIVCSRLKGSRHEMVFIKWLLHRFPALEKVVFFQPNSYWGHNLCENMETLLCFLRADIEVEMSYVKKMPIEYTSIQNVVILKFISP
ncbi:unnamed protein product [Cuscuta epithymum]|uniref:F-box/LRR-repeat protein 15/At3g58940/PEG3-like LRR domain-containing protein n=1 Tax=Cuscuta epithymum TaxID=186058 RepID=A0AAV0ETK5_9ASTE|nr:unnamed protein product [Cuscuta epithymum]